MLHYPDMFSLKGKTAVITGAASPYGIGASVAEAFAEAGADLVLADLKDPGEVAAGIAARTGVKAIGVVTDVTSMDSVENMVQTAVDAFGHIDILVNNAGISFPTYINTIDMDFDKHWNKVLDVNLNGTVRCTKLVARHMLENKIKGSIINTASNFGVNATGPQGGHSYSVSKAAVIMFTKCCGLEFAEFGIRVNAVAPGFLDTDITWMWRIDEAGRNWTNSKIPTGNMPGTEEIKGAYLYFASDASRYAVGTTLVVDGGMAASVMYDPVLRTPDNSMYQLAGQPHFYERLIKKEEE